MIHDTESSKPKVEGKKTVSFWNVQVDEPQSDEDPGKKVFIEEIDIQSEEYLSICEDESRNINNDWMVDFNPCKLREICQVYESKPIRTSVFNTSGEYFALGINSNSIKICSMHNIVDGLLYNEQQGREQYIDIVFEYRNAHKASVYCIDWARSDTQIASGSMDKTIKVLYCPDFLEFQENQSETVVYSDEGFITYEGDPSPIQVQELVGHQSTVRTVCYNPIDDKILLSAAGPEIFIWNTETAQCTQKLLSTLR